MKQIETDIAIVSAGTAGLAAAVAAAERGAEVIAFEKAATTGGTGNMGMGPFAVESKLQKVKNVSLTREEAFRIFMDYTHWRVDARLVSDYINKTASTIDWLEKMGVVWFDAIAYVKGAHFTQHLVRPSSGARPGPQASATMMKIMTERAGELGVQFYFETPVKKLLKEGDRIAGLVAEDKSGEEIRAKAKAVIIATGGFGNNLEMIKKYTGYEWGRNLFSHRGPGLVGDGIRMAWEVGAAAEGMNIEMTCGIPAGGESMGRAPDPTAMAPGLKAFDQPNLMVNLSGERFMNEEVKGNPTFLGNAVTRQKDYCAFIIFDGVTAKYYEENGVDWVNWMSPSPDVGNIDADVKQAIAKGHPNLFVVDSLEELASKTGINLANLKKTVEEYNKACDTGRDEIFHKSVRYLRPVRQPPFYAGRYFPSGYGTLGGIKINYKTEVITKDHEPIPGLYAAGVDANSIYADSYIFIFPGNTMGFALNSGRIAGENAAEYAKSLAK
jgi:fumarate reductase flavoprotein subunit